MEHSFDLTDIRKALVDGAENLWSRGIRDVANGEVNPEITEIFDRTGWGEWLRGPGDCPEGFTRPPDPDYCGLTYAYVSLSVGNWIVPWTCIDFAVDQALCDFVFSSTERLAIERWWNKTPYEQPDPQDPEQIRPGDIVVVGDDDWCGDHIVIPTSPPTERGTFTTVEGNTTGRLPGGEPGKGVVKRARDLDEVAYVWPLQREWYPENSEPEG